MYRPWQFPTVVLHSEINIPPVPVVFNAAVQPTPIPPVQLVPDHAGEVTVIVAVVPPVTGAALERF